MTLDEAIEHAEWCVKESCSECAEEYRQLVEWLKQRWRIFELEDENAKLRELVSHLMYVKPVEVTAIVHDGKLLRFDEMLAEVGMRFEVDE